MSQQQSGPVGPQKDEELKHETRGLEQGGHSDEHVVPEWLEQGTPPGMTPDDVEERSQLARFLDPSVFPASRDGLVESAQRNEAPDVVLDRLRGLPADQEFQNTQDVARAAGLGTEERRT
ncbi:MAG: DUF2795 domain-containing protein [Angustibacter sp.]